MSTPEMQLTIILTVAALYVLERSFFRWRRDRLRTMPYDEYLQTLEWKARSARMKIKAGGRCQVCNSPDNLQTHHRTYERRGHERDEDLTVLCDDCHELFSKNGKLHKLYPDEHEHPEIGAVSSRRW